MKKPLTYKESGVDIVKANTFIQEIKGMVKKTYNPSVISGIGGFSALFRPDFSKMKKPVLVSSTDGVGTKLKIAIMVNKHNSIGIDLVAMCVNDIICQGATPLFFLDYMSVGKLNNIIAKDIVEGITKGCIEAGCSLIGGETAEMPDLYKKDDYDLAGFVVGVVDEEKIIDGRNVKKDDVVIGISSSGIHSNGYSLVRKLFFDSLNLQIDTFVEELGKKVFEELLIPTKIYVKSILRVLEKYPVNSIAHITGGGIEENIIRVIPNSLKLLLKKDSWKLLNIFKFIKEKGNIQDKEMTRTFNNGIGMVLIVPNNFARNIVQILEDCGEEAFIIGSVKERIKDEYQVEWEQLF